MNNKGFSLISLIVTLMIFSITFPVTAHFFFSFIKTSTATHSRINKETEWIMISHYLYDLLHKSTVIYYTSPTMISFRTDTNQNHTIAHRNKRLGIKKGAANYTYLNSVLDIKTAYFRSVSPHLIYLSFDTDIGKKEIYVHI
jgi:type II secretory pathway pseudopilin PulG